MNVVSKQHIPDWSLLASILPHVDTGWFRTAAQLPGGTGDTIDCWSGEAQGGEAEHGECHLSNGELHLD